MPSTTHPSHAGSKEGQKKTMKRGEGDEDTNRWIDMSERVRQGKDRRRLTKRRRQEREEREEKRVLSSPY